MRDWQLLGIVDSLQRTGSSSHILAFLSRCNFKKTFKLQLPFVSSCCWVYLKNNQTANRVGREANTLHRPPISGGVVEWMTSIIAQHFGTRIAPCFFFAHVVEDHHRKRWRGLKIAGVEAGEPHDYSKHTYSILRSTTMTWQYLSFRKWQRMKWRSSPLQARYSYVSYRIHLSERELTEALFWLTAMLSFCPKPAFALIVFEQVESLEKENPGHSQPKCSTIHNNRTTEVI